MKSVSIFSTIAVAMILTSSCHDVKKPDNASSELITVDTLLFDRLVGTWHNDDGKSLEIWTKNQDGGFKVEAFSIDGKDTSLNEQATIYRQDAHWVFENKLPGQNQGRSVKFVSSILNKNSVQFSNPQHDFPTDVNYTLYGNNRLNAFIFGPSKDGGKDTVWYNFTRKINN